jgi:hypothetical protein
MHEKQSQRRFRAFRDRVTAVLAAFGLLIAATGVLMLAGPSATAGTDGDDDGDVEQVSYCHVPEGNLDNPQLLTTSVNAFFISGHPNHSADIVAAFSYAKHGETITFAGMNLDKLSQLDTGCTARPADEVQTETSEGPPNCDTNQVTITTTTTRTSYVWDAKEQEWTAGTPLVTSQTSTRDATLQECPAPDKPQPIVDVKTQEAVDCAEGLVTTTTTTSTTDWELVGNVWVKKSPVTETSTSTRPATA